MSKFIRYWMLVMMAVCLSPLMLYAQDPEPEIDPEPEPVKEYVILDTVHVGIYPTQTPYSWRSKSLTQSGIYSDTVTVPEITDKDTIYTLDLTIKEYIDGGTTTAGIYPQDVPYFWRGHGYDASGTYKDTAQAEDFATPDTIYTLKLYVKAYHEMMAKIVGLYPTQLPYLWRNKDYNRSGIYMDTVTVPDFAKADTIYSLQLTVKEYVQWPVQKDKTCADQPPYKWRGKVYSQTGTYIDTVKNKDYAIADTIYTLHLQVGETYERQEFYHFCPGESVTVRGKTYAKTTIDTVHLQSILGCDSVIIVHVMAYDNYLFKQNATLCKGGSYIWEGHGPLGGDLIVYNPGVYYDSLKTIHGCDSVYELCVAMGHPALYKDTVAICEEDLPYPFGGRWLTETGVYYDTIARGGHRCDSIIRLALTVLKDKREEKTVNFCQGTGARHRGGEIFYDARTYIDTLLTPGEGCYHIIKTVYQPQETYRFEEWKHRDEGQTSYEWHGKIYTKDGIYTESYTSVGGCDSIWILHLMTDYNRTSDSIACQGDTLFYKGKAISSNCIFTDSLVTKWGGDSVIHLSFRFMPRYYNIEKTAICSNEYIPWPGHEHITLHEEGAYYDRYQTIYGCDSIFEIDVTVNKAYSNDTVVYVSEYERQDWTPFIWTDGHGKKHELVNDTVIIDTLGHTPLKYEGDYMEGDIWHRALSGGCDSTVSIHFIVIRKYNLDTIPMCPGSAVYVDGKQYTTPGDYKHFLVSSPSALYNDSIHYFHIFEADVYDSEEYDIDSVCSNELPYHWYHRVCYASGEYKDTLQTIYGCDSIVHLHLIVKPAYSFPLIYNICSGDSVMVNGRYIHEPGIYYDSLLTKEGCDSVYRIVVNRVRTYFIPDTAHFRLGTSYMWHKDGQPWELTAPGVYYDSCRTVADGCDSVYRLLLIEDKKYFFTETQTTCENDLPYHWHNKYIYTSGTYYDSLQTVYSMDSVYELNLTVYDSLVQERVVKICPNESFILHDSVITKSGTYIDKMLTQHGCDSIIIYHVSIVPSYFKDERLHMGKKTEVIWHGKTLTTPGVYLDSLQTTEGCDSIFRLTLIEDLSYTFYDTIHVCQNELPQRWQGVDYYHAGDYTHAYNTQYGMDSVYHLHLDVYPTYEINQYINRCAGEFFNLRGRKITQSGDYVDTLSTILGCDSIVHTIVNFYPSFFEDDTLHLINGTSITWHGQELSLPGVYYDSSTTVLNGCDSIYRLHLQLADTFSYTETVIACEEDLPYLWHGQSLMQTGTYADIHKTAHNADSCYYIHFTVAPKYFSTSNATLCHGGQLNYLRRIIREPGIYNDTLLSVYGCDSIIQLIVNWADIKLSEQKITLCRGESYTVNGRTFTQSGVYEDTIRTVDGCDSIVRYSVRVLETYFFDEKKSMKPGQQYIWTGHLNNQPLTKAGVYFDSLQTVNGCDSIYRLTLSLKPEYLTLVTMDICESDVPYLWRGKYYDHSGVFDDTLQTIEQCDSIFRLTLNIHETYLEDRFYDFCSGQEVGLGGHTFTKSGVYCDTVLSEYGCPLVIRHVVRFHPDFHISFSKVLAEGESYDFYGRILTQPGKYVHTEHTQFGCDSVIELTISACSPKAEVLINLRLCTGDSVQIGDTVITQPGQYYRTYPSQYGCDSVVHYVVQANPIYHWMMRDSFCMGSPYVWIGHLNDTIITLPGRYEERLKTIDGCDSIYTLQLSAAAAFMTDTTIYVCANELPYIHKGKEYFSDMTFRDTLRSQQGCDSVLITRYHLNHHCSDIDIRTRCEGEILIIDGHTIVEDGEYRFQVSADSIHRFLVASYPKYEYERNIGSYCDSVEYEGETYYARGPGKETFTVDRYLHTIHDCDSIEHVTMTIYQSAPTIQHTQYIYDYASVWFGGQLYNTPGTYTHKYHTTHGCDSTVILHLNVLPTDSTGALHYSYCFANQDNLEVFGKYYHPTKDTVIFDTTAIPDVGMFIIQKALVHVTYPFTIKSLQTESEVCADQDIDFNIEYVLNGSYPYYYELDFLSSQLGVTPNHQEGLVNQRTSIPVTMSGQGLCVRPGIYPYRLKLTAEDCHMSDTVITGTITVRYPSEIMEANWDNVVALVNENFNAGRWKLIPPYLWQVFDEFGSDKTALVNPDPARAYLYSDLLKAGDRIIVTLLREGYDEPVPSCEFIFYPVPTDGRVPVLVYPTAVRKLAPVTIEATESGSYTLYDYAGVRIENGVFTDGTQTVTLPAVSGCYIMRLNLQSGATQTHKLIVY